MIISLAYNDNSFLTASNFSDDFSLPIINKNMNNLALFLALLLLLAFGKAQTSCGNTPSNIETGTALFMKVHLACMLPALLLMIDIVLSQLTWDSTLNRSLIAIFK